MKNCDTCVRNGKHSKCRRCNHHPDSANRWQPNKTVALPPGYPTEECVYCAYEGGLVRGLKCTKGHEPRFYIPHDNQHRSRYLRRCADFECSWAVNWNYGDNQAEERIMSRRVPTPPTQEQLDARPPPPPSPPPIYIERKDEMNRLRAEYKWELDIAQRERDDAQDKDNQIRDAIIAGYHMGDNYIVALERENRLRAEYDQYKRELEIARRERDKALESALRSEQ